MRGGRQSGQGSRPRLKTTNGSSAPKRADRSNSYRERSTSISTGAPINDVGATPPTRKLKGGPAKLTKPMSDPDRGVQSSWIAELDEWHRLSGCGNDGYGTGHWYYCIFAKSTMTDDIKQMPTGRVELPQV